MSIIIEKYSAELAQKKESFDKKFKSLYDFCNKGNSSIEPDAFQKNRQMASGLYNDLVILDSEISNLEKKINAYYSIVFLQASFNRFDLPDQRKPFDELIRSTTFKAGSFLLTDGRTNHPYGLNWLCYNILVEEAFKSTIEKGAENTEIYPIDFKDCSDIQYFIYKVTEHFDDIAPNDSVKTIIEKIYSYIQRNPIVFILKNVGSWDKSPDLLHEINDVLWIPLKNKIKGNDFPLLLLFLEEKEPLQYVKSYTTDTVEKSLDLFTPLLLKPAKTVDSIEISNWVDEELDYRKKDSAFRKYPNFKDKFGCETEFFLCPKCTLEGLFMNICTHFNLAFKSKNNQKWTIQSL